MNTNTPASEWLTVAQACEVAQVGVKLLYREIKAQRCRAARVGGRRGPIRIHRDWVLQWLEASATPVEVQTTRGHQEPKAVTAGVR
jgi:excisionase family DNA binding protein